MQDHCWSTIRTLVTAAAVEMQSLFLGLVASCLVARLGVEVAVPAVWVCGTYAHLNPQCTQLVVMVSMIVVQLKSNKAVNTLFSFRPVCPLLG